MVNVAWSMSPGRGGDEPQVNTTTEHRFSINHLTTHHTAFVVDVGITAHQVIIVVACVVKSGYLFTLLGKSARRVERGTHANHPYSLL